MEEALKLFALPRVVGQLDEIDIICTKGKFGPYLKYGDKNIALPRGTDPLKVDFATCSALVTESLKSTKGGCIAEYCNGTIQVIDGSYGPFIKCEGKNYRLPQGTDARMLSEEQCKEIIANSEPTGKRKGRRK